MSQTVITERRSFFYYKTKKNFITKCGRYYKMSRLHYRTKHGTTNKSKKIKSKNKQKKHIFLFTPMDGRE